MALAVSPQPATLTPAAISIWALTAFVFLCALCLQTHLRPIHNARLERQQQQLWRGAPPLALHFTYGSVRVSGTLPDAGAAQRLLQRARESFGSDAVVDATRIQTTRVPSDWLDTAVSLIWLAGKKLDNGSITLEGNRVRVRGSVADAAAKAALLDNLDAALSEYARLDAELSITPQHAALANALAKLLPSGTVQFTPQSALLTAESKRALNRVAQLLGKSSAHIAITGYADAVGAPQRSQRLSELRAEAVRDHLIARGVAAARMRAAGAGEGPAGTTSNRRAALRVIE